MGDRAGDVTKQPPECRDARTVGCPNLKEVGGGMEGEQYDCDVCGERYKLYYEDMA